LNSVGVFFFPSFSYHLCYANPTLLCSLSRARCCRPIRPSTGSSSQDMRNS
jgi:hypothetical protein